MRSNAIETKGPTTDWQAVDWRCSNRRVRNLRRRIFKAERAGDHRKVRSLQKLMLRSHSNAVVSVRRVTEVNAGKNMAGVDKKVVTTSQAKGNLVDLLMTAQPWRAKPVRRVYIPKASGKRPLGIPTILDRCLQAKVKNALEPQWEARFEAISYGFRPGRSAHDAIAAIFNFGANRCGKKKWVVDADIQAAFDTIDHDFLLQAISDFPAKELVKQWLKAGALEEGVFTRSDTGTPQGGVISPLLANIALHGIETALGVKRISRGEVVGARAVIRYADDFVVLCESKEDAETCVEILSSWLAQRGLQFSQKKTRIVHLDEGFDFLGFNIRQYPRPNSRKGNVLLIKPSNESLRNFKTKLRDAWRRLNGHNADTVCRTLNPIIRGWVNYFRIGVSSQVFSALDNWMTRRAFRFVNRAHPTKPRYWKDAKYFGIRHPSRRDRWVFGERGSTYYLSKLAWTNIERHVLVKGRSSPDDPDLRDYWASRNRKASELNQLRYRIAKAQNFTCPVCGERLLNGEELHEHHMILDKRRQERHFLKNIRLLHRCCHQQVHRSQKRQTPMAARTLLRKG